MARDVYDDLAYAIQAAYAEKEVSEDVRHEKMRSAFIRSGHTKEVEQFARALSPRRHAKDE